MGIEELYKEIFFSNLYRDNDFPAVKKITGFTYKGAIKVIFESLKKDFLDFFSNNHRIRENQIWVYVESVNQLRALDFLKDLDGVIFVTDKLKLSKKFPNDNLIVLRQSKRLTLRLSWYKRNKIYKKLFQNRFRAHFNTIFKYDGLFESLQIIIKDKKPKAVIMSNDHNVFCRALMISANLNKVKSVYIQHAAVTNLFPPLKFNLSLLEGQDSLDKYRQAGKIEGEVELVGMPKFDDYFNKVNRKKVVDTIGVALNNGDNFEKYYELTRKILIRFPNLKFIYRFHPSIDISKITYPDFVSVSDTKIETSFQFLNNIDILFAGNSSIHLEASVMNVLSIGILFDDQKVNDYYGFIKNNLITGINPEYIIDWLSSVINERPYIRNKAKHYVDTIDTEWDGRSKEKIVNVLSDIIN